MHPSAMAKVNWFLMHQYSPLYLRMEDYELWLRSSSDSLIYTLPEALMYYREFGIPTWKKYILSQNGIIKLYSQYKKYDISIYDASKKILITFCKIIISTICYLTGRMDLLIKMRKVCKTKPSDMAYVYLCQAIKR